MCIARNGRIELWEVNGYYIVLSPGKFRKLESIVHAREYFIQLIGG